MRADIVPGSLFPDYSLATHEGKHRSLSEIQGIDPLIVLLARGHYCPKDAQQHLELARAQAKFNVSYMGLVTISTDTIVVSREFRASVGANWPFLSDPRRIVQKDLDIAEYTDPDHDPMIPHTIVLAPRLRVHSIYNGYWFVGRPTLAELWRDLREVFRQCRPDFDLAPADVRARWPDKTQFYPYPK